MRRFDNTYEVPRKIWDKRRLEEEAVLMEKYGLKTKRELWKFVSKLRKKRKVAMKLLALPVEKKEKQERELLDSLHRLGILSKEATLDDVLALTVEDFLERRLQTIVFRKGMANTIKQARQLIVHGFIAINGKRIKFPSYLVKKEEENKIGWYKQPPLLKPQKKEETESMNEENKEGN